MTRLPLLSVLALTALASQAQAPFQVVADLPLPGRTTRFDYQSLAGNRLYLDHMGDGHLVVFDLPARKVVADLPGFPTCTGVLAVPELGRVFVSAAGAGEVVAVDMATLKVLARLPGGRFPDGLAYDAVHGRLFLSDEAGGTLRVFDARALKPLGTVPLGGEAGNVRVDPVSGLALVCVQTRDEVALIDPLTLKVQRRFPVKAGSHPHGLWVDGARRRAYLACQGTGRLLALDLDSGQVVQDFPVGEDPDVLAWDEGRGLLAVASESGTVALFRREGRGLVPAGLQRVAPAAHSISVDPATGFFYLPLKAFNGKPVLRILRAVPR
ncbi:MAG TPA: YncE family protein [Holophagaceae bacterium]|nr:YncE family protein [Holophagaceae bacterium]